MYLLKPEFDITETQVKQGFQPEQSEKLSRCNRLSVECVIEVQFFLSQGCATLKKTFTQQLLRFAIGERLKMTSYPLSNVLLPAVIVSSAVFSTLTLPFAFIKKEPLVVEVPPFAPVEIQPLFNGEHKDVAIPYIGFSIVVSVGAGMASVEVIRRWNAYRESVLTQNQGQNLQPNWSATGTQQDAINLPEYRPEISALDLPLTDNIFQDQSPIFRDTISETQDIKLDNPELVVNINQLVQPSRDVSLEYLYEPQQTTTNSTISEQQKLSPILDKNNSVEFRGSENGRESILQALDLAVSKIIDSKTLYQRCRIKVPHLEGRLFAILFEGQYYSFFRAETTKEKVLEIIAKLNHKVQKTVITKTEKGYFIWAWEPEVKYEV